MSTSLSDSDSELCLRLMRRICHDARQELAVVQALVELASAEADLPEQSKRRLEHIAAQTSYIGEMMRQTVEHTDGFRHLDLDQFMTDLVADVRLRATNVRRVRVAPGKMLANPVLLRRAVLNMLDNAIRAAGPAGAVTVRANIEGDDLLIVVEDDGPGFGNAEPGLASLGLSVVHDCAEAHGGRVDMANRESGGAFVRLRLPQVPALLNAPRPEW